jgi:hypothetical protein
MCGDGAACGPERPRSWPTAPRSPEGLARESWPDLSSGCATQRAIMIPKRDGGLRFASGPRPPDVRTPGLRREG